MKILVAWPQLLPKNHAGSIRGWAFIDAIRGLGWEPIVVTSKQDIGRDRQATINGVHSLLLYDSYVTRFPVPFRPFISPVTVNRLRALASKSGIHAVLSSTPGLFLAAEAYAVSRLMGVNFYLDVRDAWALEQLYQPHVFRNLSKQLLERTMCRNATRVFTVTESSARFLAKTHGIATDRITTIPNVADLSMFRATGAPKVVDLVFSGVPSPYRDLSRLMAGIQELAKVRPSLRVRWVGWKTPQLAPQTQKIVDELSSRGILELMAAVTHEELPTILNEARIGIVSLSQHELFRMAIGAKTFEYLACGLPIVCLGPAGDSELKRLVETNNVGAFSSSPHDFAEAANRILSNPGLLAGLSLNSVQTASRYDRRDLTMKALSNHVEAGGPRAPTCGDNK